MVPLTKVADGRTFAPLTVRPGERVFVLTGAGISAESGVRTFRDSDGLWEEHNIEDVATPEGFERDPLLVWRFYSERRRQALEVVPNPAHRALADLGGRIGERLFLCTQNIDPLHEKAGSPEVTHMHGELLKTRCDRCERVPFQDEQTYFDALPGCECGGRLRPHVVWFGEMPFEMGRIYEALEETDLFITVGSSGAVYPAAGFVSHLRHRPNRRTGAYARCIYVGLEKPENAHSFDECRLGKAGELLPDLFRVE